MEISPHRRDRWKVIGQHPPLAPRRRNVKDRIENVAQLGRAGPTDALWCGQQSRNQRPFLGCRVTCVSAPGADILVSLNSAIERLADETPYASLGLQPVSQLGARLPSVSNLNSCLGRPHDRLIPQNKDRIMTLPRISSASMLPKTGVTHFTSPPRRRSGLP